MNYCDMQYFAKCATGPISQKIMRSNNCFELIYVKCSSCSGTIYFDGDKYPIESNEIIILPPNVKYRFDCDGKGEYIFIGFCDCDYAFHNEPAVFNNCEQHSAVRLLDLMTDEFNGHRVHRKYMLNLLLNVTLISLCRLSNASDVKKETEADNFNYILHFMDAQSQNGIDIDEVSKMSGLSYHRFRHKFKELTAISPQQYIIRQRLNFAKNMLETTHYTTSSIAEACGFHSVPQFITCFSKQEGLTPVKYRKKYQACLK